MGETIYIRGKPYNPNHVFLYYYYHRETYWFKNAEIEDGQKLRPFDSNGDRTISFEDLHENKLKLVELAHFSGVKLITANSAQEAIQKIPGVRWGGGEWVSRRGWKFDEEKPATPVREAFPEGVSLQALDGIRKINERSIDVNRDGFPDRFELDVGRNTWAHTLRIYWGLKEGFTDWQIVKTFEYGTQILGVEWVEDDPKMEDFGSVMIHIAPDAWRTGGTCRLFAYNSRPYEDR